MWDRVSSTAFFRYVQANRARIASALLAVFVLGVLIDLSSTLPRATSLAYDLGEDHARVRTVALSYTFGDESVREARRHYPEGAPSRIGDTVDLVPGRYRVRLDLSDLDGHVAIREGEFDAPGEGVVVVHLRP